MSDDSGPIDHPDDSYSPPLTVLDDEGRAITIQPFEQSFLDSLVEMYDDYPPEQRAQGIPPATESQIREWLETILPGYNLVARHDGDVVGHATLLSADGATHELSIFIHPAYQLAGIGSRLIRALLAYGREHGVEQIWLSVQQTNFVAVGLYRSVGFDVTKSGHNELEMALTL